MLYQIYKITNQLDGKIYIGRTTKKLEKRWAEHRVRCYNKKLKSHLYRAMRKYGVDNFTIESVRTTKDFEELKRMEGEEILKHQSHLPNIGYNLVFYTDDGVASITEDLKKRIRTQNHITKCAQSKNKNGFIGVYERRGQFSGGLSFNRVDYVMPFDSKELAAIGRDKLCLYFYGNDGVLNFPNNIYTKEELEETFKKFDEYRIESQKYSSEFKGVIKQGNCWRAKITYDQKVQSLGYYTTELEAATVVDKCRYYFFGENAKFYNFPEKIEEYKKLDKQQIFDLYIKERQIRVGVVFTSYCGKYAVSIPFMRRKSKILTYCDTPEEGLAIRDMAVLYLGLNLKLNRPDLIGEYKFKMNDIIKPLIDKASRLVGVTQVNKNWKVFIKGQRYGTFKTKEEAEVKAREVWAAQTA